MFYLRTMLLMAMGDHADVGHETIRCFVNGKLRQESRKLGPVTGVEAGPESDTLVGAVTHSVTLLRSIN